MGARTLLCCVLWCALAVQLLALPICVQMTEKKQIKELERLGYTIVRNVEGEDCVWVELPQNEARAMNTAIDKATAAVTDGEAGRGQKNGVLRKARKDAAAIQAAMQAALPFQQASCAGLKAAGVATNCEFSGLFQPVGAQQGPTPGDIAAATTQPLRGVQPQAGTSPVAPGFLPSSTTCSPGTTDDEFQNGELLPYGLRMVGANDSAATPYASNMINHPVMVCVIDSGISASTIGSDLYTGSGFVGGLAPTGRRPDFTNRCRFNWNLGDLHGGHVFGTVAALRNSVGVRGVITNGGYLRHCNVFGTSGQGADEATILNAVGWCVNERDRLATQLNRQVRVVISMSLGGPSITTSAARSYASYANREGVMIVAAAGNEGPNRIGYPAGLPEVVSVGAVDRFTQLAPFSNTNTDVEISAPGVDTQSWYVPSPQYARVDLTGGINPATTINPPYASAVFGSGTVTNELVSCGLATALCPPAVSGKFCLVDRGVNDFCQKAANCVASGGRGMLIVDNIATCSPAILRSLSSCTVAQQIPTVLVPKGVGTAIKTAVATAGTPVTATFTFNQFITPTPYGPLSGTSMATPHVSSATAVVWATNPRCPTTVVRQAIKDGASKPASLFPNGATACNTVLGAGCGVVNIPGAITKLAEAAAQGRCP